MLWERDRLVSSIGVFMLAGFLVTTFAGFFVSRASLRAEITSSTLPLTSDNIYSEIQRDLQSPLTMASMMAGDTFLRDWLLSGERDPLVLREYLQEIKSRYHSSSSFLISEATRNYYSPGGILKQVRADEERDRWYFRLRQMADEYEVNVDPDMANNDTMTIFVNYKVLDYHGNFIGAAGVGVSVSAVKSLIHEYQSKFDRTIYFVDEEGNIVLSGGDEHSRTGNIYEVPGLAVHAAEILSTEGGSYEFVSNDRKYFLQTRRLPDLEWYLLVEQNARRPLRSIWNSLIINLLISVLVTTLVLFTTSLSIAAYRERLERIATTDKLTGFLNRQAFDILINQTVKETERTALPLSIIMLDIDHFKNVNDQYGHLAGDDVLVEVAGAIRSQVRDSDVVCRWGGEEFIVVLKDCDLESGYTIAEKIRTSVKESSVICEGSSIRVTASLGIARYHPGDDVDTLLSLVDKALYAAKKAGRDQSSRS